MKYGKILLNPKFWFIAAIAWAVLAVIGFIMLFTAQSSPQVLSLAEIVSVVGCLGSWLNVITGATVWGQNEMLRRQDEALKRQDDMLKRQDETLQLLREALQLLREVRDALLRR